MTLMMRDLENQEIGIEKGIEKGIERGRSQRDKEMIEKLLRSGKTPEEIYDFCGYPMELILEVQNEMLVAQ